MAVTKPTASVVRYARPAYAVPLGMEPQLASWDAAGHPSQLRLTRFLEHIEAVLPPMASGADRPLALELVVGLPERTPLYDGGRDLDNYLFPLVQRLGARRLVAVFGRKVHGRSSLAIGPAEPAVTDPPMFAVRMVGSYQDAAWKHRLRDELVRAGVEQAPAGPIDVEIGIMTGPGRNWAYLWKPLLDAFGPVLGEDPARRYHPYDDRIVSLGLHHNVDARLGHDVIVRAWWAVPG